MEDIAIMTISPHLEYSPQEIESFRIWCMTWASGEGDAGFQAWLQQGARMRELLTGGMISPVEAARIYEEEKQHANTSTNSL
jgi:hypothetical protein